MKSIASTSLSSLLLALTTASCTILSSKEMVPQDLELETQHDATVAVEAKGTPRSMLVGKSLVPSSALETAVREAVIGTAVFSAVAEQESADYHLAVTVEEMKLPEIGLDMEVEATLRWVLREAQSGTTVWEEPIRTGFTATSADTKIAGERRELACEGALRANIQQALETIADLEL